MRDIDENIEKKLKCWIKDIESGKYKMRNGNRKVFGKLHELAKKYHKYVSIDNNYD